MSPIPDDFEQLRRLLALKRHEQPPPGYFHSFSREVIVRIKAGDLGNESEISIWSMGVGTLFQRVWATLDARPVFAGAFGVAVCGFFVAGALLSDGTAAPSPNDPKPTAMNIARPPVWEPQGAAETTQISSTMGAITTYQPPGSLFEEFKAQQVSLQRVRPEQVDFRLPVTAP